jgi:uncharacterized membrane protein YkoI
VAQGAAAALLVAAVDAGAAPIPEPQLLLAADDPPTAILAQRSSISLEQATAIARRQHEGRLVKAEPVTRGGRLIYEIRILGDDGRVRTVRIDAETGQML